ncbi:MAG: zinc ribbon domain-containing protein [Candidatus Desulfofervidaceae bacterium]|nr:zinc ribbon domain-containing protein [Candidatus Desulfofervidaceae bacterium]
MPIYEYVCDDCGHRFECLVRSNDKITCPKCQGTNLTRLLSACSFSFGPGSNKTNTSTTSSKSCSTCSAVS